MPLPLPFPFAGGGLPPAAPFPLRPAAPATELAGELAAVVDGAALGPSDAPPAAAAADDGPAPNLNLIFMADSGPPAAAGPAVAVLALALALARRLLVRPPADADAAAAAAGLRAEERDDAEGL